MLATTADLAGLFRAQGCKVRSALGFADETKVFLPTIIKNDGPMIPLRTCERGLAMPIPQ
jgi:hypothetical protein